MKHLGIFALLATMALGAPAEQSGIEARAVAIAKMNLAIRNAPHQGDGLYIASSDENGDYTIDFTPWEELEPVPAEITEYYNNATANAETTLKSRGASVTCSGRDGSKDLLRVANEAAANNAQAHGSYAAGSTGWVSTPSNRVQVKETT